MHAVVTSTPTTPRRTALHSPLRSGVGYLRAASVEADSPTASGAQQEVVITSGQSGAKRRAFASLCIGTSGSTPPGPLSIHTPPASFAGSAVDGEGDVSIGGHSALPGAGMAMPQAAAAVPSPLSTGSWAQPTATSAAAPLQGLVKPTPGSSAKWVATQMYPSSGEVPSAGGEGQATRTARGSSKRRR